ncbi:hypothetical protein ACFVWP_32585 [Streptomyces sp. NPDC058175]|uniref:hypothetical protein n=1 Tax=Streptomyces sp. NPDC058175 TaxID=3346367 RepID=UPI0036E4EBE3
MSAQLRPWRPEDFDDQCETCGAPPGQLCRPSCDTGFTAEDSRREAELRDQGARTPAPSTPTSHPTE